MTAPVLSLTETQILTAVRAVLLEIVPSGVAVLRSQNNLTPMPAGSDFIYMTHVWRRRLETNLDTYAIGPAPIVITAEAGYQCDIQLDVYGPNSTDNAQLIGQLWRDDWTVQAFANLGSPIDVAPLYADEARQMPLITGEDQYLDRWTLTLSMQGNFTVTVPQDFLNTLTIGIIDVDVVYPP